MPKKGRKNKTKENQNTQASEMPEETPFLDSSVSSEADELQQNYFTIEHQANPEAEQQDPEQQDQNYYNDGQDWPDDMSDSDLAQIREFEAESRPAPTMEEQLQAMLHTRVRVDTTEHNPVLGSSVTGKLLRAGQDTESGYIVLGGIMYEGRRRQLKVRFHQIVRMTQTEDQGAMTGDDDTMSVRSFRQKGGSAQQSPNPSNQSSRSATPDIDIHQEEEAIGEEHTRPDTALSGVLNLERDEDIDQMEELLTKNQEHVDSSIDTEDNDDEENDEDDKQKVKSFINSVKEKLRGKFQIGSDIAIADMMESVQSTCESMGIHITKEKIKKMFIPHTMDFKRSRDLAALYRLIKVKTTGTPRKRWKFLTRHAFEDEALFENAKTKWILACKARVNQHLDEQRRARNYQEQNLDNRDTADQIWNTNTLTEIMKKSAKELDIRFSGAQIEWALSELKPSARNYITALQSLSWWERMWTALATHPMSKIPLTWNSVMKDVYPRDTYPTRGYLRQPHRKAPDELTVTSSSEHEMDTKRSPPPDPDTVQGAKNRIVDDLAINGPMIKSTPDEINKNLDWLARNHANAKTFFDKLDDKSRKRLANMYNQWKEEFPIEPFKVIAYRKFPYLYDLGIDDENSVANMERYIQPQAPPKTPKEWMQLFREDCRQETQTTEKGCMDKERDSIKGNSRRRLELSGLDTVTPKDFQKGGRLAHIYIGRQCKIPPEVLRILGLGNPENSDEVQMIWRPLYAARLKAAENYKAEITTAQRTQSPWLELLCDERIHKDFHFDEIDKTQYAEAWEKHDFTTLQMTGAETLYNIFIRPLERMFTVDMPMNHRLMEALHSKDGTTDLAAYIIKLVGWDAAPFKLDPPRMIEELSKIRAIKSGDLQRTHFMDAPTITHKRQACRAYPDNNYSKESVNERARRLGCEDEMLFQNQSKESMDEMLESITKDIQNLLIQLESGTEEIETIRYQQKHTREPAGLRKLEDKKETIQAEITATREELTRKWRDYRLTAERRNLLTYRPEKTAEQTRQDLMGKTSAQLKLQLKQASEEFRASVKNLKDLTETYKATAAKRFNFFSQDQANVIFSMMSRIKTQERHLKDLNRLKDAIIIAIAKQEEEKRPTPPVKHHREEDNAQQSVKVPRVNWLEKQDFLSSSSEARYPGISTPRDSSTDVSMVSEKNPRAGTSRSLWDTHTHKNTKTGLYPSLEEVQQQLHQNNPKPTLKQPQQQKTKEIHQKVRNSWMETQPKRTWPQVVNHWPQPGNRLQPEWTTKRESIKGLQERIPFMTLKEVMDIRETPRVASFTADTGLYKNKITITVSTFTSEKDQLEIPLGLHIVQESSRKDEKGRPVARRMAIPQQVLDVVETSLKVYENLKLNPLATENTRRYREENTISHKTKNGKVETTLSTENEDQQKYRAVIIRHIRETSGDNTLVRIPWIHLPIFNHYYEKMAQEIKMIIARYEAKKGPRSFEKVDPEQKLKERHDKN